jgi:hypothetical protein
MRNKYMKREEMKKTRGSYNERRKIEYVKSAEGEGVTAIYN